MKVQLVSDVHLEFKPHHVVNVGADVLALCGDICVSQTIHDSPGGVKALRYRDFFKEVSANFEHVLYVLGNHESYHGKVDCSARYLRTAFESWGLTNVIILDRDTVELDGVVFLGATLWTDMNDHDPLTMLHLRSQMNDFKVIRVEKSGYSLWTPERAALLHKHTLGYFKSVLDNNVDRRVVVLTHHAPSFHSVDSHYEHEHLLNGGYYSDLEDFIQDHPQIVTWCHGHIHCHSDYHVATTRVLCNPLGYPGEVAPRTVVFQP